MKQACKPTQIALSLLVLAVCMVVAGCSGGRTVQPLRSGNWWKSAARKASDHWLWMRLLPYDSRHLQGARSGGTAAVFFSRRTMIAGELPNSPENLARWIKDPKVVEPGTAMPDLGLSDEQSRDIAAYLETLR